MSKFTQSPCHNCPREQACNSPDGGGKGKDCCKWREWFKITWRETVDPLRKRFNIKPKPRR